MPSDEKKSKKIVNTMLTPVFLSLGSNLDQPEKHIKRAFTDLKQIPSSLFIRHSPLYLTAPVGFTEQPDFINACVELHTTLPPHYLLEKLWEIEKKHGRKRDNEKRWHPRPRPLDIDILLYGSLCINDQTLSIPHPRMLERLFVIQPLADIAPTLILPNGMTVNELMKKMQETEQLLRIS